MSVTDKKDIAMKKILATVSIASALLIQGQAHAWEPGTFFVRAGAATVAPDESSDPIAVPALGGVGAYDGSPIAGTGVSIDNNTQLGLTATYMFTGSWGVELLAATPFTHDITADLGGLGKVAAGEATHLPPSLSAIWYPFGSAERAKPYVGAGLTYVAFIDRSVNSTLEAGLSGVANAVTGVDVGLASPVPLKMDLDNTVTYSLTAGLDYELNDKWHLNATVRYVDLQTDAKISNDALGTVITIDDINIDPFVYQINIGYRF